MTEAAVQISEEYKISLIPSQELIKIWDQCEPILFKSCKRSDGRDRPVDIFYRCTRNQSSLWIIFDDSDLNIIGCVVTNLHDYPSGKRMLHIEHVAGKQMDKWADLGLECMYKWSAENKCEGIEAVGRTGFVHWIKDREEWRETSRFYEMKLKGE
jgi:hypothetical protein